MKLNPLKNQVTRKVTALVLGLNIWCFSNAGHAGCFIACITVPTPIPIPTLPQIIQGGGDALNNGTKAVTDAVSGAGAGGGNSRQRDWDACVATKNKNAEALLLQITERQGEINVSNKSIEGLKAQIAQSQQETLRIQSELQNIDSLLLALQAIETQQGTLQGILLNLNSLLEFSSQDKRNIQAWLAGLEQIRPQANIEQQITIAVLTKQMKMAMASQNSMLISSLLLSVSTPNGQSVFSINSIWLNFKSTNESHVKTNAAMLTEKERAISNEERKALELKKIKTDLESQRSAILNSQC